MRVDFKYKLYLIDDDIGILGSANFTESGLNSNVELSLYIENEPELLKLLHDYFSEMKNTGTSPFWN